MVRPDETDSETEVESEEYQTGRWTAEEHERFLQGLKEYNKQWKLIADLIRTRTVVQVRTHAQKHFQKVARMQAQAGRAAATAAGRSAAESLSAEERASLLSTAVSPPLGKGQDSRRRSSRRASMAASSTSEEASAAPSPKRRKSENPAVYVSADAVYPSTRAHSVTAAAVDAMTNLHVSSTLMGTSTVSPRPSPTSVADVSFSLSDAAFNAFTSANDAASPWLPSLAAPPSSGGRAAALKPMASGATSSTSSSYTNLSWLDDSSATASASGGSDAEGWATESEMSSQTTSAGLLDLDLPFPAHMLDEADPVFGPSLPPAVASSKGLRSAVDDMTADMVITGLTADPGMDLLSLDPLPLNGTAHRRAAAAPAALEEVDQDVDSFVRSLLHFPSTCAA